MQCAEVQLRREQSAKFSRNLKIQRWQTAYYHFEIILSMVILINTPPFKVIFMFTISIKMALLKKVLIKCLAIYFHLKVHRLI